MMGIARSRRGFSLIEAMIVVCLVGILAVVANLAYRRWRQTAYLSEAQDMVNNIRAAEESFRAENGGYLGISNGLGPDNDYPAHPPGQFKTAWGAPCTWCAQGMQWSMLNVQASAPLMFGYSVIAGNDPNAPSGGFHLPLNGQQLDIANGMAAPWYVIEADGDTDGNNLFTHVYGLSATNQIFIDNEGE
jgi:prepilin-type N-terminal cleavage/methylation domain-containing protein